jgi:hypothetical protein
MAINKEYTMRQFLKQVKHGDALYAETERRQVIED